MTGLGQELADGVTTLFGWVAVLVGVALVSCCGAGWFLGDRYDLPADPRFEVREP